MWASSFLHVKLQMKKTVIVSRGDVQLSWSEEPVEFDRHSGRGKSNGKEARFIAPAELDVTSRSNHAFSTRKESFTKKGIFKFLAKNF